MASYRFKNSENIEFVLKKPGDYPVEIIGYKFGLSKDGDAQIELKFSTVDPKTLEPDATSGKGQERLTLSEKATWRVDTFLKCCGVVVPMDSEVEFDPDEMEKPENAGKFFVDLRGLRGWASIINEQDQNKPDRKYNKIGTWYTNKPKLPRRIYPALAHSSVRSADGDGETPF